MGIRDNIIASTELVSLREQLNSLQEAHDLIGEKRTGAVEDQVFYDLSALVLEKARQKYKDQLHYEATQIVMK